MRELIIGGARSGKSALAEQRALESGLHVVYVATAQVLDGEMSRRIAHHRARRPAAWGLVETPLELAASLQQQASADTCLLVDCLTLWLSNLLFAGVAAQQAEAGQGLDCALFSGETRALIECRLPSVRRRTGATQSARCRRLRTGDAGRCRSAAGAEAVGTVRALPALCRTPEIIGNNP